MQSFVTVVTDIKQHRSAELPLDVDVPLLHVRLLPIHVDSAELLRRKIQIRHRARRIVQTGVRYCNGLHEWRVSRSSALELTQGRQIEENAIATAKGSFAGVKGVPCESDSGCDIAVCLFCHRVAEPRILAPNNDAIHHRGGRASDELPRSYIDRRCSGVLIS